jgi:hypothetical protein
MARPKIIFNGIIISYIVKFNTIMKTLIKFVLVFLVFNSLSCKKEDTIKVTIPLDKSFDLNEDMVSDIAIKYIWYSGSLNGSEYEIIKGQLIFDDPDYELMEYDSVGIFLHNNDTIFMIPDSTQHSWKKGGAVLITKFHYCNDDWPEYWNIRDGLIENSYLLGFKMHLNTESIIIGYMRLTISNITGDIIITESKYTDGNYIKVVVE